MAYIRYNSIISIDLTELKLLGSFIQLSHRYHTTWACSQFTFLALSNNNLTGELPKCYGLVDFYEIDVGNNHISGNASFLFEKPKSILNVVLANNAFEFDLSSKEFSDYLCWLDLSHNKIYGKVPDSFMTAPSVWAANFSFNRLCGELPQGEKMRYVGAEFFTNNECLCGRPLPPCFKFALAPAPVFALPPFWFHMFSASSKKSTIYYHVMLFWCTKIIVTSVFNK